MQNVKQPRVMSALPNIWIKNQPSIQINVAVLGKTQQAAQTTVLVVVTITNCAIVQLLAFG